MMALLRSTNKKSSWEKSLPSLACFQEKQQIKASHQLNIIPPSTPSFESLRRVRSASLVGPFVIATPARTPAPAPARPTPAAVTRVRAPAVTSPPVSALGGSPARRAVTTPLPGVRPASAASIRIAAPTTVPAVSSRAVSIGRRLPTVTTVGASVSSRWAERRAAARPGVGLRTALVITGARQAARTGRQTARLLVTATAIGSTTDRRRRGARRRPASPLLCAASALRTARRRAGRGAGQ